MVGDYLQAVNGTDVTSIPHSEAAELARQGKDPAYRMDAITQNTVTAEQHNTGFTVCNT